MTILAPAGAGPPSRLRLWPLGAGLLLLAGLWFGPLPGLAAVSFSSHMILHLGVALIAAPLVAIGLLRAGLGPPRGLPVVAGLGAAVFEMAVVWGWHAPAPHEAAAREGAIFVLQQASFLAAGMAVWAVAFGGRGRAEAGIGALVMLATFAHMAMLGVLLTLPGHLLYPPDICGGAFGLSPLEDQRLGGTLMAVGGGLPYLGGGLVLLHRLIEGR